MTRAKSIITRLSVTAAVALAVVGASAPAFAGPGTGPATTQGVWVVRAGDGGTRTVPMTSGGTPVAVAPLATGPSYHGCPYGAVCVYPANTGWNGDHPKYFFYSYAGHNIYGEYGTHRIADNQYGGHAAGLCAGSNGTGGYANGPNLLGEGSSHYNPLYWDENLTPVNSLDLRPYSQYDSLCNR